MFKKYSTITIFGVVFIYLASACNAASIFQLNPPSQGQAETLAAETIQPFQTERATQSTPTQTLVPTNTPNTPTGIPTMTSTATPTRTSIPSLTPWPSATPKPVYTSTPVSLITPGSPPTSTTTPCNRADFIGDVTIPDGTKLPPNVMFTKVWRIKNTGTCTWDSLYKIVFISGDRMKGKNTSLPRKVRPGDIVDVAVNLESPSKAGIYKGNWKLSDGVNKFGSGSNANNPFWVQIRVVPNTAGVVENFALSMCTAKWESSAGLLPCPGNTNSDEGFVIQLSTPNLETGPENELTLVTFPEKRHGGWISGTFPQLMIESGYRFLSDVGCLAGYPFCDINFELYAKVENNPLILLGEWREVYDHLITRIDLDLSYMAGKHIQLILAVRVIGDPMHSAGFWLMPQIRHTTP